jgi:WD40 repeat protein
MMKNRAAVVIAIVVVCNLGGFLLPPIRARREVLKLDVFGEDFSEMVEESLPPETDPEEYYLLWSYKTGTDVCSVAISGDGRYAAVSNVDGVLYLFEVENAYPLWNYSAGNGASEVSISSDGQFIAAYLGDTIFLFDRFDNEPRWSYSALWDWASSVSISADGEYIVGGRAGLAYTPIFHTLFFFSRENNIPLWAHDGHGTTSVSISSDGKYIIAAMRGIWLFNDKHVLLWRHVTPELIGEVSISSDGSHIIGGGYFSIMEPWGKIYFFGREENTPLWSYQTDGRVLSVAISSDGSYAVAGSSDNRIYFFGREENAPLWSHRTGGEVLSVAISSDGTYVIAGSSDDRSYLFARRILPPAALGMLPYVMVGVIVAIVVAGLAFMLKKRFA